MTWLAVGSVVGGLVSGAGAFAAGYYLGLKKGAKAMGDRLLGGLPPQLALIITSQAIGQPTPGCECFMCTERRAAEEKRKAGLS